MAQPEERASDEIRAEIKGEREHLETSLEQLGEEIDEAAQAARDARARMARRSLLIGAAVGGLAGIVLFVRRRRSRRLTRRQRLIEAARRATAPEAREKLVEIVRHAPDEAGHKLQEAIEHVAAAERDQLKSAIRQARRTMPAAQTAAAVRRIAAVRRKLPMG